MSYQSFSVPGRCRGGKKEPVLIWRLKLVTKRTLSDSVCHVLSPSGSRHALELFLSPLRVLSVIKLSHQTDTGSVMERLWRAVYIHTDQMAHMEALWVNTETKRGRCVHRISDRRLHRD